MPTSVSNIVYKSTLGITAMQGRGFYFPYDFAFDNSKKMYVLGRGHDGDPRGCRITVMDFEEEYYGTFGSHGEQDGQFIWPSSIAINSHDKIFVSDEYLDKIIVLSTSGEFLFSWGQHGTGDGDFDGPNGLTFDGDGNLLVVDHRSGRIQVFDEEGGFIRKFGSVGNNEGQMDLPWGISTDSNGHIYVADWGNHRVQEFLADETFVKSFGYYGNEDGQLIHPSSVTVDSNGFVYIADWGNHRLQVYDSEANFICSTRGEATLSKWAQEFLDTNVEEKEARLKSELVFKLDGFEDDPHEESAHVEKFLWSPTAVKVHNEYVLIAESNRHRLQVFHQLS